MKQFTDTQRLDWLQKQRINIYDYSGYDIFRHDDENLRSQIDIEINEEIENEAIWNKINKMSKEELHADLERLGYTKEDLERMTKKCMELVKNAKKNKIGIYSVDN